jgi:DNA repair protein RadC
MSEESSIPSARLKDQPASERPREKLAAGGPEACSHAELIAILLRTGLQGMNVVDIGRQLLQRHGSLRNLALATVEELCEVKGIGRDKAVTLAAAFALAKRMAEERKDEAPLLDCPVKCADALREDLRLHRVESFLVALLDVRRRLIKTVDVSQGLVDTILVHPREVFRTAIVANASAIVLAHNHPSGDPTPSEADIKVTRDLVRAGQVLKITVLDHLIFGQATTERAKDWVSLRELGYLYD